MPERDEDLKFLYSRMRPWHRLVLKLLMKIPIPSVPFVITRKLPSLEGIFHGIALPVFVFLTGIFTYWLIPTATIVLGFPFNIVVILAVLALPLAFFARVELERSIHWWRSAFGSSTRWNTSEIAAELSELFERQQRKKTRR